MTKATNLKRAEETDADQRGAHVARTGALAELTREELVGYLVPAIRALLAPAIAAAEGGR
jgi:hypothetical protein